jgi:hypoxanthine phosphoribosyltransferase
VPRRSKSAGTLTAAGTRLQVVISSSQIRKRLRELARQIDRDFDGKTLHVIGILEDGFLFMADLIRALKTPVVCHFVRAEVKDETLPGGVSLRAIQFLPHFDAAGKDVLLVDGLLQSGVTLDYMIRSVQAQGAKTVRTAVLVEKADELKVDVPRDYVGFKKGGKFLLGYGLGYDGKLRNLPCIATPA